jgi:hypothetical protein
MFHLYNCACYIAGVLINNLQNLNCLTVVDYLLNKPSVVANKKAIKEMFVCLMVFNATFNNISVISSRSVLLVEESGGPGGNHRPVASH